MDSENSGFPELAGLLWSEREILRNVLFKIVEERLVLSAGEHRWLAHADGELAAELHRLRGGEVMRAAEADAVAIRLNLPAGATLTQLAELAPEPWASILREHRDALRQLSAEVEQAIAQCHLLLEAGSQAAEQTLAQITTMLAAYDDPDAPEQAGADPANLLARRPDDDPQAEATEHLIRTRSEHLAYQRAMRTASEIRQTSLLDFLT